MSDYEDYLHRQYGPDLDDEAEDEKPPTYTVSGNYLRVQRLDAEGNPTGDVIDLSNMGAVTFDMPAGSEADMVITDPMDRRVSIDIEFQQVDPDLLALLAGRIPLPPYEVWGSPRLYRWLPRFIKRRLKSRWIRRGYGG